MAGKELSKQARSVWAKTDRETGESWLPLYIHMHDSFDVAMLLWDEWLPRSTKETIARSLEGDCSLARSLCCFLAGVHDIGKATPVFQTMPCFQAGIGICSLAWKPREAGLYVNNQLESRPRRKPSHPIAGEVLLESYLEEEGRVLDDYSKSNGDPLACVIGAHHGMFPKPSDVRRARDSIVEMGIGKQGHEGWVAVQHELITYVTELAEIAPDVWQHLPLTFPSSPVASLIDGLIIMADWVASNQDLFPLIPLLDSSIEEDDKLGGKNEPRMIAFEARAHHAWSRLHLTGAWAEPAPVLDSYGGFFKSRFALPKEAKPRPIQTAALEVATTTKNPGLLVIEAPMGEGKTEAALAAAEVLACRCGCGGVCVALPTMATTDAMFARVDEWLERLPHGAGTSEKSIYLAHGKAQMNEQFQGIIQTSRMGHARVAVDEMQDSENSFGKSGDIVVSDWMFGRKKGMLANFVVCTVDQVLMGALEMRHLSLRQLAIANKVVIIDECHAYDLYMRQYLNRLLEWLGYWRTPVILLSATLPVNQRDAMVKAYLQGKRCSLAKDAEHSQAAPQEFVSSWKRSLLSTSDSFIICPATSDEVECGSSYDGSSQSDHYPLLTYTDCEGAKMLEPAASGRRLDITLHQIPDDLESLSSLFEEELKEGGCVGVICDTVSRAQIVAENLETKFGEDAVLLDHSRFMDIDRMDIERHLRDMLGPDSTLANNGRPNLLIVVGTQVLEQSLDIDFDLIVTDVAPVDLIMQRLGRVHRHVRGADACDRPTGLRHAKCYIRGIDSWNDGLPHFARGITNVYDKATLMESLAVLRLSSALSDRTLTLPPDIPLLVRHAYSDRIAASIPKEWRQTYESAVEGRKKKNEEKVNRAQHCLLQPILHVCENDWTLMNLADTPELSESRLDSDAGQRAVRDTQETVEVLLLKALDDGMALLPWIGDEDHNIALGSRVPVNEEPSDDLARIISQSAVRLPSSMCQPNKIDGLIDDLEEACGNWVAAWQDSSFLSGRLVVRMACEKDGVFGADVGGRHLLYSRLRGLEVRSRDL